MADDLYVQCVMRRGDLQRTSFIPKQFAQLGKVLMLKDRGVWSDGWRVEHVGAEQTDRQIEATSEGRMYFATRQSTDSELKR